MTENFNSFEVAASTQAQASAGGALAPYLVPHGDGITYVMTPKANRYLRAKQMANDTESNQAQINTLDVIIAINSSYPEPYIKRGILLTRQGEIQLAVADFTTAISLDINCAIAFSNRGTCRNMIDRFDLALDDFNSALTIKDDLEAAYFGRAIAHNGLGEHEKSFHDLSECIRLSPNKPELYYMRARNRCHRNDLVGADLDVSQALLLAPTFVDAHILKGCLQAAIASYDVAIAHLTEAINLDPEYAQAYESRSAIYKAYGRDDYRPDLRRAFELDGCLGSNLPVDF